MERFRIYFYVVSTTLIGESKPKLLYILRYLETIQVKSKILYFKYVLFIEIWLTYGTEWVSQNVFSNFEDLN